MTLNEFRGLDIDGQGEALLDSVYLEHRVEGDLTVQLHSLGDFYVEAYLLPKESKLIKFKPFRSLNLSQSYLSNIDLSDLSVSLI